MYDIGIIGGGTAGMTAAIYGQRAGKRTIIIEGGTFGGQITSSPNVENYPGIASVSGSEFSMNLLDQAMKLGAETQMAQVTGIRDEGEVKVIVTPEKEYPCRSIVLATGVTHRHLGVPNEERLTGAGVSYCATCDGMFFRGKEVAVVGGGNTAIQDAEFLSDYCSKVYLIHRRDEFRGENSGVKRLKEKENVEFILSATVKELVGESMVEKLILNDKKTGKDFELHVSGVFVAVGQIPKNETFADTVKLDEGGFVLASEDCLTSHPGIFAAGDCRTKEVRQLTTAAADGAVAALAFAFDMPLVLIPVGIIYILETLSDIIQVGYFKATHGKRFFKMAPLHHHLERCGWSEVKIVTVFVSITAVFCLLAYCGIRGRYL